MHINLVMPPEAVALVLEGLGKLPLERSRMLFDGIEAEAKRQIAEAQKPAKKTKAKAKAE